MTKNAIDRSAAIDQARARLLLLLLLLLLARSSFTPLNGKRMRIEPETKLDFKDVLIRPKRSTLRSRNDVELSRTFTFKHSKRVWRGVPVMVANMDNTGTLEMARAAGALGLVTCLHKFHTAAAVLEFCRANPACVPFVAVSAGISDEDFAVIRAVFEGQANAPEAERISMICLDVANGYSEGFVEAVRKYRAAFPTATLIAGNVVTGEMTEELILSGADIVKVGIGPGSVCTTRIQTGVGYPQLSAVIECADAAHGLGGLVISDGGCTCPGDFAKAFGAGADFVMSGGMFAGHDESGGETITKPDGSKAKLFWGMSSTTAMEKHVGQVAEYRSSEGKTVEVPYRGPVMGTIKDILGGLRSACTYVGASALKEMSKRTTFIRVTQQVNTIFSAQPTFNKMPDSYFASSGKAAVAAAAAAPASSSSPSGEADDRSVKKARTSGSS